MTIQDFLSQGVKQLKDAGIDSARLDCLLLLEDELGIDRAHLLAHPETALTPIQAAALGEKCALRATHFPLAYIRGKAFFYGRTFMVTPRVLVPRPETETMITLLTELQGLPPRPRIVDIGTGSGCIGISAALEIPSAITTLYDIDPDALAIAQKNAETHGANVRTKVQDLLSAPAEAFDVVLANLPYVPENYAINTAASFEPALALFAGDDGLDLYRSLWQQLLSQSTPPKHVLTEALHEQHAALASLAEQAGYTLANKKGLIQHFVRQGPALHSVATNLAVPPQA